MIAVFNRKNPRVAVTGETLQRSLKTRAAYARKAENGIQVNKKLRGDLERIDFAAE